MFRSISICQTLAVKLTFREIDIFQSIKGPVIIYGGWWHGRTGRGGGRRGRQPPSLLGNKASRAEFASQSGNIGLL
jgi:hypothetical protein